MDKQFQEIILFAFQSILHLKHSAFIFILPTVIQQHHIVSILQSALKTLKKKNKLSVKIVTLAYKFGYFMLHFMSSSLYPHNI